MRGKQFENTYWIDPETGLTHTYRRKEDPYVQGSFLGYKSSDPAAEVSETADYHVVGENGDAYQGMLFNPHLGTGTQEDPNVSPEDYESAVRSSMGLAGSPLNYARSYRRTTGKTIAPKAAAEQMDRVVETARGANLPTHVLNDVQTTVVANRRKGRSHYLRDRNAVNLMAEGSTYTDTPVTTPGKPEKPIMVPGKPIFNPDFHRDTLWNLSYEGPGFDTITGQLQTQPGVHMSVLKEDGSESHVPFSAVNGVEAYNLFDAPDHNHNKAKALNVWMGKGRDTESYLTRSFKVTGSWNPRKGGYDDLWVHTRHEAVPDPEGRTVPAIEPKTTWKTTKSPVYSSQTLAHEIGHSLDQSSTGPLFQKYVGASGVYDPMSEGLADGFADRHVRYKKAFQSDLVDNMTRALPITGYSTTYSRWDSTAKALYAATRTHAASADDAYKRHYATAIGTGNDLTGIPDRSVISEHLTGDSGHASGNHFVLGWLYHNHEHVRDVLENAGLGNAGRAAQSTYLQYAKNPHYDLSPYAVKPDEKPQGTQLTLF